MRDELMKVSLQPRQSAPIQPVPSFIERKAVDDIRANLSALLSVPSLYDLDRLDLTAKSTLDRQTQEEVVRILRQLSDGEFVRSNGLVGENLLGNADPSKVVYSLSLSLCSSLIFMSRSSSCEYPKS